MARHRAPSTAFALSDLLTPGARSWLYGIALAALALLGGYKVLGPEEVPLWASLVESVLGLGAAGTAVAFRPTGKRAPADA